MSTPVGSIAELPSEDEWSDASEEGDQAAVSSREPSVEVDSDAEDSGAALQEATGMVDPTLDQMNRAMQDGNWAESLALLFSETQKLRDEQQALRLSVDALGSQLDRSLRLILARLGPNSAPDRAPMKRGSVAGLPLRAMLAEGPTTARAPSPPKRPATPPPPPPPGRKPARQSVLGVSTSAEDDAPACPVNIWTGTWNVGAAEPVGNGKHSADPSRLAHFVAPGFDVYVLALQEGVSDKFFEAFAKFTGTYRLPLVPSNRGAAERPHQASGSATTGPSAIAPVPHSPEERAPGSADAGAGGTPVTATTAGGNDRVLGRGDGSLVGQKFTAIAVFVSAQMWANVRCLRVDKLSFGTTEGSKGGVGVALRVFGSTLAFISCHLASKKVAARLLQYKDLCKALGAKLGNEFFHLNEQFHHIVWMGDFNYRCSGISGEEALRLVASPEVHRQLLAEHDDMLQHREESGAWFGYEEPPMAATFYPTYKRIEGRPPTDYSRPEWPHEVFRIHFREPIYKGGRVMDRVPGWCDRILYRSLEDMQHRLEPLRTADARAAAAENLTDEQRAAIDLETTFPGDENTYACVNDHLVCSDHAPVRCVFRLSALDTPRTATRTPSAAHHAVTLASALAGGGGGGGGGGVGDEDDGRRSPRSRASSGGSGMLSTPTRVGAGAPGAGSAVPSSRTSVTGVLGAGAISVVLRLQPIEVQSSEEIFAPAIVKALCPAPFELSDDTTVAVRATKQRRTGNTSATLTFHLGEPERLPTLHLLLKVALLRKDKGHAVVSLRALTQQLDATGSATVSFFEPLMCDGVPRFDGAGQPVHVQFTVAMQVRQL